MESDALQAWRVSRLQALVDNKFGGNKTRCGQALGYKDGAYIRQILARKRPINEKTIADWKLLAVVPPGWFDGGPTANLVLSEDEIEIVLAHRMVRASKESAPKPATKSGKRH